MTAAAAACAAATFGVLLAIAPAAAAPSGTAAWACRAQGARHVEGKRATTTYLVDVFGVTCDFANPWVAKLTHTRPKRYAAEGHLSGGPRGWTCGSGRPYPALAYRGGCYTKGDSVFFGWKPYFPATGLGNNRVYDIQVVGSASSTSAAGKASVQWTQTIVGFRIRLHPEKIGRFVLAVIAGDQGTGTESVTVDSEPGVVPPGCPGHATYQLPIKVGDSLATPDVSEGIYVVGYPGADAQDCIPPIEVVRCDPHPGPGSDGSKALCLHLSPTGTILEFPTYRRPPGRFHFPLAQIVAHHAFTRTLTADPPPFSGPQEHLTARVTFTPRP